MDSELFLPISTGLLHECWIGGCFWRWGPQEVVGGQNFLMTSLGVEGGLHHWRQVGAVEELGHQWGEEGEVGERCPREGVPYFVGGVEGQDPHQLEGEGEGHAPYYDVPFDGKGVEGPSGCYETVPAVC